MEEGEPAFELFEALTLFDWISPAIAISWCMKGWRPVSCWWSRKPPIYYQRLLWKNFIDAKVGGIAAGSGFVILVPAADVDKARRILKKAGAWLA